MGKEVPCTTLVPILQFCSRKGKRKQEKLEFFLWLFILMGFCLNVELLLRGVGDDFEDEKTYCQRRADIYSIG